MRTPHSLRSPWKEVIRKLKAAGFVEKRRGKGSHVPEWNDENAFSSRVRTRRLWRG
jgi:DNA-binding FadR family transcriptional regulator